MRLSFNEHTDGGKGALGRQNESWWPADAASRAYRLVVHGITTKPTAVKFDGAAVAVNVWSHGAARRMLSVQVSALPATKAAIIQLENIR